MKSDKLATIQPGNSNTHVFIALLNSVASNNVELTLVNITAMIILLVSNNEQPTLASFLECSSYCSKHSKRNYRV